MFLWVKASARGTVPILKPLFKSTVPVFFIFGWTLMWAIFVCVYYFRFVNYVESCFGWCRVEYKYLLWKYRYPYGYIMSDYLFDACSKKGCFYRWRELTMGSSLLFIDSSPLFGTHTVYIRYFRVRTLKRAVTFADFILYSKGLYGTRVDSNPARHIQ